MLNALEYLVIDEFDRVMMHANESIVCPQLWNIFDFVNISRADYCMEIDDELQIHEEQLSEGKNNNYYQHLIIYSHELLSNLKT